MSEPIATELYNERWDLSTIPDTPWKSENGRRNRAKQPRALNVKFEPCVDCGKMLTARQRRKPCPYCLETNR